jgi:hypothetical protein
MIKSRRMRWAGHVAYMKKKEILALVKAGINFLAVLNMRSF